MILRLELSFTEQEDSRSIPALIKCFFSVVETPELGLFALKSVATRNTEEFICPSNALTSTLVVRLMPNIV